MKRGFFTVLLSVLLSGVAAYAVVKTTSVQPNRQDVTVRSPEKGSMEYRTVNLADSDYPDFTYAAESAVETVVYVEVTVQQRMQYQAIDPFFQFFFGDQGATPQSREVKGSGSGVIISPDGYIVTNNHVINGATSISVTLNNNEEYTATVVGTDPVTDVAIIKIDASGLTALPMGDSDNLRLGEWVLAIGSPLSYNLRSTITAGIVSAKGRSMPSQNGEFKIESFIQTDAAVNPGNSGGALVNKKGELVGINTAIISQTGSYSGYSFAIPVNIVKKIAEDLMDFGSVQRAVLGVTMRDLDKTLSEKLKLSSVSGVYINEVLENSAASEAGLRAEDVIVDVDGTKITGATALQAKIASDRPGDTINITYIRDGKQYTTSATLKPYTKSGVSIEGTEEFYGARIRTATEDELKAVGAKSGVIVVDAGEGKLAGAGASEGFVIEYVNDRAVSTPQEVANAAKKALRTIFIQGRTSGGKTSYFAFGK